MNPDQGANMIHERRFPMIPKMVRRRQWGDENADREKQHMTAYKSEAAATANLRFQITYLMLLRVEATETPRAADSVAQEPQPSALSSFVVAKAMLDRWRLLTQVVLRVSKPSLFTGKTSDPRTELQRLKSQLLFPHFDATEISRLEKAISVEDHGVEAWEKHVLLEYANQEKTSAAHLSWRPWESDRFLRTVEFEE